jgi:hypothetical protein
MYLNYALYPQQISKIITVYNRANREEDAIYQGSSGTRPKEEIDGNWDNQVYQQRARWHDK